MAFLPVVELVVTRAIDELVQRTVARLLSTTGDDQRRKKLKLEIPGNFKFEHLGKLRITYEDLENTCADHQDASPGTLRGNPDGSAGEGEGEGEGEEERDGEGEREGEGEGEEERDGEGEREGEGEGEGEERGEGEREGEGEGEAHKDKDSDRQEVKPDCEEVIISRGNGKRVPVGERGKEKENSGRECLKDHMARKVHLNKKRSRSGEPSKARTEDRSEFSIKNVMALVKGCGATPGTKEFFVASEIFTKRPEREMFMTLETPQERYEWLKMKQEKYYP